MRNYVQNMGGVDIYDQMIKSYYNERKSAKWTNKPAIYLINMMLHNSFILYKMFYTEQNKIKDQVTYRKTVIEYLASDYKLEEKNKSIKNEAKKQRNHWPSEVKNKDRRECVSCRTDGVRKTTRVKCQGCDVFLCIDQCFSKYHTQDDADSGENSETSICK